MSEFDYVIVGAGSAGCVLAARLSEAGAEVLLIEAGGSDRAPKIKIPAAFSQLFKSKVDWAFTTDPEPGCDNRSLFIPRGRALGGSSSINAMLYVRGHRDDYDGWREAGCAGWGWDDVLPYFIRSEHREAGASPLHGIGGELNVAALRSPRELTALMLAAARERGFPPDPDYNDGAPWGAAQAEVTQRRGRRWSAADAFLRPALGRRNLTVLKGVEAIGVELSDGRATGVRVAGAAPFAVARARREVICAAGAIGSPKLLMLAGIGDPDQLREAGVEPRVELPGVGANLQDHPYVTGTWEAAAGSLRDAERPRAVLEFLLRRRGPLTSPVAEGFLFTRSAGASEGPPDLQLHLAPAYFADNGFEDFDGHALTMGPVLVAPRSRGSVRLRSADPTAPPRIVTNSLTDPADLAAILAGVRLVRELAATAPLAGAIRREIYPGPAVGADEEALAADARRRCELLYHPVGTCRMGTGADAVVDPELRVRGVEGLRVADASIMPAITRGNTNAPTIMIAEKAADLILGRPPLPLPTPPGVAA